MSISVAFTDPNLYAKLRCHDEAVFGALLKHFAGSSHRARMLNAASASASPASAPGACCWRSKGQEAAARAAASACGNGLL